MKVKIEIDCDTAAFEDYPATEIARILRQLAGEVEVGFGTKRLHDINGNPVGKYEVD